MYETELSDKRVVITGGSAGLGLALAKEAERHGARVAVIARDAARLQAAVAGTDIQTIAADIANKQDTYRISGELHLLLGGVDILVNNASYLGVTPLRLLIDSDCEDLEAVLAANLLGPFRLTKALLPGMILRGSGLVVNISSDAAVSAYPTWGSYGASKAALDHLSRVWQEELAATGVRFLAIDPGDMNTAMHAAAIPDADPALLYQPADVAADLWAFLGRHEHEQLRYSADEWRAV